MPGSCAVGSVAALALSLSSSSSLSELPEELLSKAPSGAFRVPQAFHTQGGAALAAGGTAHAATWDSSLAHPLGVTQGCSHRRWDGNHGMAWEGSQSQPSATMGGDTPSLAWDTARDK